MESKPIWQSWTFWFNLVSGVILFLQMPEVQAMNIIPQGWMAAIVAIGNVVLRLKTSTAVTLTKKAP